jgi:hypothetical protein
LTGPTLLEMSGKPTYQDLGSKARCGVGFTAGASATHEIIRYPMGFFYFDESVHSRGNFALGAFAYSESSLEKPIAEALRESGLRPYIDEFKSGSLMTKHPEQARARDLLRSVLTRNCQIGIVVSPSSPLELLGREALRGLHKILSTNSFVSKIHDVFLDEGILASDATDAPEHCSLHFEQDSVTVLGLQIADLVAHTCATMLLARLGLTEKTIKAGPNSGYDPDGDMPLEFELWAGLRWNFFAAAQPPYETWKSQLDFQVDVESRGLHISDACDEAVKTATLSRFGRMYLGCIH